MENIETKFKSLCAGFQGEKSVKGFLDYLIKNRVVIRIYYSNNDGTDAITDYEVFFGYMMMKNDILILMRPAEGISDWEDIHKTMVHSELFSNICKEGFDICEADQF